MSDAESDFVDYIDSLKRKEQAEQHRARVAQLRQEWRETTWAGYLIWTVESLGIAGFFEAIGNSFEKGEDSASYHATRLVYKIGIIAAGIIGVYVVGWIVRMITGEEFVVEQEVVIVEEVTRAQAEALDRLDRERERREKEGEVEGSSTEDGKPRRRGKQGDKEQ
ncbi:hypothetical protein ACHAXT_004584 [Thalassiosira profunda]